MRSSVCSLFISISVLLAARPGDGIAVRNITAVLGQSVTLRCPGHSPVQRLYIQKNAVAGPDFINGFDTARELDVDSQYKNRTTVNRTDLSMEMRNISVSDEGSYNCVVFETLVKHKQFPVYLTVTAEYNIPNVTAVCSEPASGEASCQLSCWAAGGYPRSVVRWAELNLSLMSDNHNNSFQDQNSKTWTINQSLSYHCNQPTNISCSIEGATSETVTICKGRADDEKISLDAAVISAIAVLLLIIFIVSSVYVIRKCCGRRRPIPGDAALEVPLADCHSQPQGRCLQQHPPDLKGSS